VSGETPFTATDLVTHSVCLNVHHSVIISVCLSPRRADTLSQALAFRQFSAGVDEEETWIQEKQHLLSASDYGEPQQRPPCPLQPSTAPLKCWSYLVQIVASIIELQWRKFIQSWALWCSVPGTQKLAIRPRCSISF